MVSMTVVNVFANTFLLFAPLIKWVALIIMRGVVISWAGRGQI